MIIMIVNLFKVPYPNVQGTGIIITRYRLGMVKNVTVFMALIVILQYRMM